MRRVLFSCFCGLLWSSIGWAADPLGTININLHGNVVDFSCTVNTADIDKTGNDSNLLIVFYVQIMPDDFVMQLHRF